MMRGMHLALVTETYPPEVNGVAMTLQRLVQGLAQAGWSVEVVRPRQAEEVKNGAVRTEVPAGVTQRVVPGVPIPFYQSLRMGLPVRGALRRAWRERRPEVVHVATEGPLGWAAMSAAEAEGIPVTSSYHTNFHQYGGHYGLKGGRGVALKYLRWFHNRARCTLAPTQQMCDQLAAEGFLRLGVLARGVDAALYAPSRRDRGLRASWGAGEEDPVVIYVGRVAAEKNLGLAVEAFLRLRTLAPRAQFVVVGDGPERAGLEKKYPEFHYAGVQRGEALARHYASADLFLFPSTTETFGNVVTEAMASGLVVQAFDYAAPRQHLRDGESGVLVPFGEREAFLTAVDRVWASRGEWPTWRARARVEAERIGWERVIRGFGDRLAEVAAGR